MIRPTVPPDGGTVEDKATQIRASGENRVSTKPGVLQADWARSGRWPVAWLSLDAADSDPARFWRYVVTALDRVRPGIGELAGALLGPPAPRSFEGLVTALINRCYAGCQPPTACYIPCAPPSLSSS